MKKVLSLVLVLTLVLGSLTAFAAPASDVAGTEYEAAVERLSQLGVLTGYPDGTFKPNNTITRAEFAAAVVRVKGLESAALAAQGSTVFTDVPAGNWAAGYVNIASKLGIVKGMGDGTFAPNAHVTYEQAVTMVMRALGYEAAAEARGGYPYGYLIVANEAGLLDAVKGVQGLAAPRGIVAQLLDNALEVKMMVQVGFGTQERWVVSGTDGTEPKYLFDELGFSNVKGRVESIAKSRVTLRKEDNKTKVLVVDKSFDFNYAEGRMVKAWYDAVSDNLVIFTTLDEVKYDATNGDTKVTLVGENSKYVVADNAKFTLNGDDKDAKDFTADYAKVVLNADGEIAWAKGYTLPEFIVVKEVKDEVVYSYDLNEQDLEDFTILKDGRTLDTEDLEEGDILLFNKAEEFAVVYNESKTGELERVYDDEFKFAGKVYAIKEEAKYLDGKKLGELTSSVLDEMMDEDKNAEVFFNLRGAVVLVVGNRGEVATNSFYGRVTAETVDYKGRSGIMWSLDVRNEEGKVVSYDLTEKFVKNTGISDSKKYTFVAKDNATWSEDIIKENAMVRITLDTDGKPTKVELLELKPLYKDFKISAVYAKTGTKDENAVDYKLQPSTLVFEGKKVTKLEDAEGVFSVVKAGSQVYVENGRVELVIGTTDADSDTTNYTGLVKKVRPLTSGASELTVEVFGETKVFLTGTTNGDATDTVKANEIATVTVGNKTEKISVVEKVYGKNAVVESRSTGSRTIVTNIGDFELNSKAVVYNIDSKGKLTTISLRDLEKDDNITVYTEAKSGRFVNYVIRTADAPEDPETPTVKFVDAWQLSGDVVMIKVNENNVEKDYKYGGTLNLGELQALKDKNVILTKVTVSGEDIVTNVKVK